MQDKIHGPGQPIPTPRGAQGKTSPTLFENVSQWLTNKAQTESLSSFLNFVQGTVGANVDEAKQQQGQSQTQFRVPPKNAFMLSATNKTYNAEVARGSLAVTQNAILQGNTAKALVTLSQLSKMLMESKFTLPAEAHEELNKALKALLAQKGKGQKTLGTLLLKNTLNQTDSKEEALANLANLAYAIPPTFLTQDAKTVLAEWQEVGDQALTEEGAEPLMASLLKEGVEAPEVKTALERGLTTLARYGTKGTEQDNYQKEMAEQYTKRTLAEMTKPLVASQLKFLANALKFIKEESPEIIDIKNELATIDNLNKNGLQPNMKDLLAMIAANQKVFNTIAALVSQNQLPLAATRKFLDATADSLDDSLETISKELMKCVDKSGALNSKSSLLTSCMTHLGTIGKCMEGLKEGSPPSFQNILHLLDALMLFSDGTRTLEAAQNEKASAMLSNFSSISLNKKSMTGTLGEAQVVRLVEAYTNKAGSNGTVEGLKAALTESVKALTKYQPDNTLMAEIVASMQQIIQDPSFPASKGGLKSNIIDVKNGVPKVNPAAKQEIESLFAFAPVTADRALKTVDETKTSIMEAQDDVKAQQVGFRDTHKQLLQTQDNLKTARTNIETKKLADNSLPNEFLYIILQLFMPNQQAILQAIAILQNTFNIGTQGYNALMSLLSQMGQASGSFNLASFLNSLGSPISASKAKIVQSMLTHFTTSITSIINSIQAALGPNGSIQNLVNQLEAGMNAVPPTVDPKTAQAIITSLEGSYPPLSPYGGLAGDLTTALGSAQALLAQYQGISITQTPGKSTFTVNYSPPASASGLSAAESLVTQGDPNGVPPILSFSQIFSQDLQTPQGTWSMLSTGEQIQLSSTMTEVQQEWTVVGTCMQDLNSMYMTIAQGIYH